VYDSSSLDDAGPRSPTPHVRLGAAPLVSRPMCPNLTDLDRLYEQISRDAGRLDVVFANAGGGDMLPLEAITAEHVDRIFGTNVKGLLFTVQKALPLMKEGAFRDPHRFDRWAEGNRELQRVQRDQSRRSEPCPVLGSRACLAAYSRQRREPGPHCGRLVSPVSCRRITRTRSFSTSPA